MRRLISIDHHTDDIYILAMVDDSLPVSCQLAQTWLDETRASILQLQHAAAQTQEAATAAAAEVAALHCQALQRDAWAASVSAPEAALYESASDSMQRASSSSTLSHASSADVPALRQPHQESTTSMRTYCSQMSDDSMAWGGPHDMETGSAASDIGSEGLTGPHEDPPKGRQAAKADADQYTASGNAACVSSHAEQASACPLSGDGKQHRDAGLLSSTGGGDRSRAAAMEPFRLRRPREQYMRDVAACLEALAAGESYEVSYLGLLQAPSPCTCPSSADIPYHLSESVCSTVLKAPGGVLRWLPLRSRCFPFRVLSLLWCSSRTQTVHTGCLTFQRGLNVVLQQHPSRSLRRSMLEAPQLCRCHTAVAKSCLLRHSSRGSGYLDQFCKACLFLLV